ncbi:hypothetical protein RhiirA5_367197 [Rhizophagus irregularis]|uniref:Uncharacterized protein n=1 Tax=Rhizophagus irregularis TaxID=588596 RepID=A0A2N0NTZ6_9GLOM|nr:hypothetical protein RhiirA5_367197 [Rhizophagus irregularis]
MLIFVKTNSWLNFGQNYNFPRIKNIRVDPGQTRVKPGSRKFITRPGGSGHAGHAGHGSLKIVSTDPI